MMRWSCSVRSTNGSPLRYRLVGMPADDPFTEAVTAVRRAAIGDQEESRLRIFVLQAWNHGIVVLAARVQRSGADQFMQRRFDDMFQLRVVRAVPDQLIVE